MDVVFVLKTICDVVFVDAELQVDIICNFSALNLHLYQAECLESLNDFTKD